MHSQEDFEHEFLNLDAYFASANNDEDLWSNASQGTDTRQEADDDELLDQARAATGDDDVEMPPAPPTTTKHTATPAGNERGDGGGGGGCGGGGRRIKKETTPEHSVQDESDACGRCCGGSDDECDDLETKAESSTSAAAAAESGADAGAVTDSGPGSLDMLDDGTWLDFDSSVTGAELASPTLMRRFSDSASRPTSTTHQTKTETDLLCDEDGDECDDDCFLLGDDMDLPDFSDADVAGLLPSPIAHGGGSGSTLTVSTSSGREAMPHHNHRGSAVVAPLPSPSVFPGHSHGTVLVCDQDIPDMVNLFSSMYSPSEAQRQHQATAMAQQQQQHNQQNQQHHSQQQTPLSIMVPTPQLLGAMFPFSNMAGSPLPLQQTHNHHHQQQQQQHQHQHRSQSQSQSNLQGNPYEYFTPPGVPTSSNRVLDPNSIFLNADAMSPPTKNTSVFQQAQMQYHQNLQQYQSQYQSQQPHHSQHHAQVHPHSHSRSMSQTQAQQQMQAATAAAVAMANSAAAINTMRKLNTTYGVPIAPLQRSLTGDALPLKPKLLSATATSASTIAATFGSSSKVSKISITPDISDFKLVQIFHNFCDPATKILTLQRFHQLLQFHQGKDDHASTHAAAAAIVAAHSKNKANNNSSSGESSSSANSAAAAAAATTSIANSTPTIESQTLFKTLDKKNAGVLDLEAFMSSFQICNRCTEAKRRAHSAVCAAQGQSFTSTALERQLMEDVAPVIVRVVPQGFEGSKVKSCEHYQWTWCEGFEKTGNEKCRGTNRHDKCPKYLANCTLWKHKLPPKNRKPKVFENIESPSKKFKHFA